MKQFNLFNNKTVLSSFLLSAIFICLINTTNAQDSASRFKNSVKVNVTSTIIYDNAWQLSYERILKKNRSLNVVVGYNEFPTNLKLDLSNTQLSGSSKKSGYMFGVDYRFYLSKENKYSAPHGVYLAPFVSFYQFNGKRDLIYTDSLGHQSSSNLNTNINFLNIGGELGYQFVLGKRWVIDAVVFGPAYTHYKFGASLDSNIPGLDEDEAIKAVIDAIKAKFPLLDDLSKEGSVNGSGNESFWSVGFRYNISIGFRF